MSGELLDGPGGGEDPTGGSDWPRRLLAVLVTRTAFGRGEWGRAMLAELDEVPGTRGRWAFALGAARTMVLPGLSASLFVVASFSLVAVGVVAAVASLHWILPSNVTVAWAIDIPGAFVLAIWAALAARDSRREDMTVARRVGQVGALAVVAACLALSLRLLTRYSGWANAGWVLPCGLLAVELIPCVLLLLRRPEPLSAGRYSGIPGLASALAVGAVFAVAQPASGESDNPVVNAAVLATGFGAPLAAGVVATLLAGRGSGIGRRLRAAVGEVAWGYLLTGPVVFAVTLLVTTPAAIAAEAAEPVFITEAYGHGATSVTAWVSQDDFGGALVMLVIVSTMSLLVFLLAHALHRVIGPVRAVTRREPRPVA